MKRIGVLWFSAGGYGPDAVDIQLQPMLAEPEYRMEAKLGLRVRAGVDKYAMPPRWIEADGGFYLDREAVADLHQQIGEWLAANPAPAKEPA